MAAPVFIGDEVTAAGYRLAGAEVRICEPAEAEAELERALERAPWILLAATHAARVPPRKLQSALAAAAPLVIVVRDAQGRAPIPDLGAAIRRELGVAP